MSENQQEIIELRHLCIEDYVGLKNSADKAYEKTGLGTWHEKEIQKLLDIFPEGQLCITLNGKVVASALSLIINYDDFGDDHTYNEIHGNYSFKTHDSDGDVLYGIDVFVHPEYRGMRLGRRLYEGRKELCENLNLRAIMAGGRIPNYKMHADTLTPRQYIEKVQAREIYDPTLTFQLANGFHVKKVLKNYLEGDVQSQEFATLLEWNNIYYQPHQKVLNVERSEVRVGLVQWQMRPFSDMDKLMEQAEYFVDAVSGYNSDFLLFPEFFNAPLMAPYNHLPEAKAMRELAAFAEPLRDRFLDLAVSYNVNIITGSMPVIEETRLLNISYLCRRDGTVDYVHKIHPTPSEVESWGMVGGDEIKVLDTDCGKIGILICYDVEFPEVCRLMADDGMRILFVPFCTDTQNGFMRVRRCAQARAIENECYVAVAGAVGNLPNVNNMDIQYAQSAVFTPSDFSFPTNTIKTETTPNTEMVLIADVDLNLLKELHARGSVRNLKDRRRDLYRVVRRNGSSR